jgi:hypothetical protein
MHMSFNVRFFDHYTRVGNAAEGAYSLHNAAHTRKCRAKNI